MKGRRPKIGRVLLRVAARATAVSLLLTAALLMPAKALAYTCDRTDSDRWKAARVVRDLTGEINAMERAIIEALRLQTGQLSGYIAQSAKMVNFRRLCRGV